MSLDPTKSLNMDPKNSVTVKKSNADCCKDYTERIRRKDICLYAEKERNRIAEYRLKKKRDNTEEQELERKHKERERKRKS